MRNAAIVGILSVLACASVGCARGAATPTPKSPSASDGAPIVADKASAEPADLKQSTTWIGASAEGELLAAGTTDTFLGVWVDVPTARPESRPPMELALVIDTSGSMAGEKIANARSAAAELVKNLHDGDIVALDTFSDSARTVVPPTRLDGRTRAEILRAVSLLTVGGSTNMFEGLTLAEGQVAAAPPTHALRRVVVISDGIANVGPSTPESLGQIAERGLRFRAQVTSLGVGIDYDERTLNALSMRSSGRLYHITEPREMASILKGELDLLDSTVASDAFVEVVPAPGVRLAGAEGVRADWGESGSLRIPLGALHAGQHREALVRVALTDPGAFEGQTHAIASVRLRFRDAQDSDLERIQEVVARAQLSGDSGAIARTVSSRTKAIVAIQEAAKVQLEAAQRVNKGQFGDADKELERAERTLTQQAQVVTSAAEKKRLGDAAGRVAAARHATRATASAPKEAQRGHALKMNAEAMHDSGF